MLALRVFAGCDHHEGMLVPGGDGADVAELAAVHDGNAIADPQEFGQVAAHEEDCFCGTFSLGIVTRQFVEKLIDLGFRTDIDSASRFVQQKYIDFRMEQTCQSDFLLVATGEGVDGLAGGRAANGQFVDPMCGSGGLSGWRDESLRSEARETGQRHVLGNRKVESEAFCLTVFTYQTDLLCPTSRGRSRSNEGADR